MQTIAQDTPFAATTTVTSAGSRQALWSDCRRRRRVGGVSRESGQMGAQ